MKSYIMLIVGLLSSYSYGAYEILAPEVAFPMELKCSKRCTLTISPVLGHYVYDNIKIKTQDKEIPITIKGQFEVINNKKSYTQLQVSFSKVKDIEVYYQGCKESVFCYAVQKRTFSVK